MYINVSELERIRLRKIPEISLKIKDSKSFVGVKTQRSLWFGAYQVMA